jgi:predicted transposase/invertase (TIGR01784 family)
MKTINTPHDATFKALMVNQRTAEELFSEYLPENIRNAIDFSTMQLCSETYIDKELQKKASDILYSVNIKGNKGYLYILAEHQSSPDKLMPLRIAQYTCAIMQRHKKEHPEKKLPLVVPLVLYHGKKVYPYSTDLKNLIDAPEDLIDSILFKPFTLIDANTINDEDLREKYWMGLMVFVFKHIVEGEIFPHIKRFIELWQLIAKDGGKDYIITLANYISTVGESADGEIVLKYIAENIDKETGGEVMTIAEQIAQKAKNEGFMAGMEKGKAEGKTEGEAAMLVRQLKRKFGVIPEKYLQCIDKADADTLLTWGDEVISAQTMNDIFE